MKRYNELLEHILSLEKEFDKFYNSGNKTAGTRLRKGLLEVRNLSQTIRVEVQGIKNSG